MRVRRIVTNVESHIETDEVLEPTIAYEDEHNLTEIWTTHSQSPRLEDKHQKQEFNLNLELGCTRFVTCTIPPFESIQAEQMNNPHFNADTHGMHSTQTIDYVIVFDGELELKVGNKVVALSRGDTVVQRGAIHAWHNKSNKPATIIAVMIGAEKSSSFSHVHFEQMKKQESNSFSQN